MELIRRIHEDETGLSTAELLGNAALAIAALVVIEFVYGWLRRNVPKDRYEISCLQVDSAQFLFDQGREVDRVVGALGRSDLQRWIDSQVH